jgi:hypothetical protein
MYGWIWRRLPFGLAGKLAGSVLIATALVALMWYVVFPWAEPLLPFDDVQVTQDTGNMDGPAPGDSNLGPDDFDLPYSTTTQDAPPPSSPSR